MTPYVSRFVSEDNLKLFYAIKKVINDLPDVDLGSDNSGKSIVLSCHMLARAVAKVWNLQYEDGLFSGFSHSWVKTPDEKFVIDCYPVGIIGGPILVDASNFLSPANFLYNPTSSEKVTKDLDFESVEFKKSVLMLEKIIGDISRETH